MSDLRTELEALAHRWETIPALRKGPSAYELRAILAAHPDNTTTEWGTGEGADLMTWRDRGQAERQSASATKSSDGGKTWKHTSPPVVSRQVTPWEREA